MKVSKVKPILPYARLLKLCRRSGIRVVLESIVLAAGGFLLSAAAPLRGHLPLAACLICAFPPGHCSVFACAGSVGGYLLFSSGIQCAELIAMCLLMLAAVFVFQGTDLPHKTWFFPLLSGVLWGILGGIGLGAERSIWLWLLQCILCAMFATVYRRAVSRSRGAVLLAMASYLCALSSLALPLDFGFVTATALCVAAGTPQSAIAFGLAVELAGQQGASVSLCLSTVLLQSLQKREAHLYALGFLLCGCTSSVIFAVQPAAACISVSLGAFFGLLAKQLPYFTEEKSVELRDPQIGKLRRAAKVLHLLHRQLPEEDGSPCVSEAESVYDGAAERVCRCCERFHRCWEERAGETCTALGAAAGKIISQGKADIEDFSLSFRDGCCYIEGFVTAVNQELDGMLFRRQYRMRLRESRRIVAQELACLEEFLLQADQPRSSFGGNSYLPEVGVCSIGKKGESVNGDRNRSFYVGSGRYYILLCDGMGTGEAANRMSGETVELLEHLLKSGLKAESALKLLNGAELLRGEDRFTTVDLLTIDLRNGEAELMKWGSAPSFYRKDGKVQKIGTASPPPGVGMGGEHSPERYMLSLSGGELLVLRSDGACSEEIEEALRSYTGKASGALAAYLISGISKEDDMTALTVSLRMHLSS